MTNHDIDRKIMEIAQGDIGALETLYNEMKRPVYHYALQISGNREIAEDAMQDTFISIMSNSRSYIPKGSGRAWILTITKNKTLNLIKKQNQFCPFDGIENQKAYSYQMSVPFEDVDSFMDILRPLNKKEHDIVVLRILVGLTLTQIAKELALPKGSVFWSYNNAMKKLKKSLINVKEFDPCIEQLKN
ncbi:MAG: RNA polymerase sigma factor [Oscillospiraceae bacterium]|nr:RNA polymerase sigma factor [Oscillospiraceae bacterium]